LRERRVSSTRSLGSDWGLLTIFMADRADIDAALALRGGVRAEMANLSANAADKRGSTSRR
jgi:hypothetical protein